MARKKVITKYILLDYGLQYLKEYGFDSFTARDIAQKFGISTQPIYSEYLNMNEYRSEVLKHTFYYMFDIKLSETYASDPLISYPIAFVRFSEDNPNLYHALFVKGFAYKKVMYDYSLAQYKKLVASVTKYHHLTETQIKNLHLRIWISVNGMAAASISEIYHFDEDYLKFIFEEMISHMLEEPNVSPKQN